jgi:outer membrane protein assembly factor BamB
MPERKFEITKRGGIRAIDPESGRVMAERPAGGTSIVQLLPLGSGVVVREDYYRHPAGVSNVYYLDAQLDEVWRAELPWPTDAYANPVTIVDGRLQVASWECWTCALDPSSGRIVRKDFTK